MQNASRIMYKIGRVFNWIELVLIIFAMILAIVCLADPAGIAAQAPEMEQQLTPENVRSAGIALLVGSIISLLICIAILCLATKAIRSLAAGSKSTTPHIIMIVIGVFADIFYLLGGIFGIIASNNKQTTPSNNDEQQ